MNYGIVTEFNPFHNGHKYLVDSLKSDGVSTVTAVMSGNFVQRGEPAVINVNLRAEAALNSGVDLVLSLPLPYSVLTAEKFAFSGVNILDSLNCLDSIAFGSESNNKEKISDCAEKLLSKDFNNRVSELVREGVSFPVAREQAVDELYGEELSQILMCSNDILGVEYVKALINLKSDLDFKTIKRTGAQHDSGLGTGNIRSASMIRSLLNDVKAAEQFMPEESFKILRQADNNKKIYNKQKFELTLLYKLRTMTVEDFRNLPDVTEGLEYRIFDAVKISGSYTELLENIKTKRYTLSRIRRILLCAYLGITKEITDIPVPYIRVLAFNENGAHLLKKAKENATLPIITRSADLKNLDANGERIFELECRARDLYSLCLSEPDICGKEMTDKIIIKK